MPVSVALDDLAGRGTAGAAAGTTDGGAAGAAATTGGGASGAVRSDAMAWLTPPDAASPVPRDDRSSAATSSGA
jgi:hypothetical protein